MRPGLHVKAAGAEAAAGVQVVVVDAAVMGVAAVVDVAAAAAEGEVEAVIRTGHGGARSRRCENERAPSSRDIRSFQFSYPSAHPR